MGGAISLLPHKGWRYVTARLGKELSGADQGPFPLQGGKHTREGSFPRRGKEGLQEKAPSPSREGRIGQEGSESHPCDRAKVSDLSTR
jgi:hypothetical protein